MVRDVFGLHTRTPTEREIEAGAAVLRERQTSGKITRVWADLPNSTKKKWREHAEAVLKAAYSA